jgi:hypothetical protein
LEEVVTRSRDTQFTDSSAYERFAEDPLPAPDPWPDPYDVMIDLELEKSGSSPDIITKKENHEPCPT